MDLATLRIFAAALFVDAGSPAPGIAALMARVDPDRVRLGSVTAWPTP